MNPYSIFAHIRHSVYRKCPADGWAIDTRTIADHEFVLITGGIGYITIEGKVYTAKQGMLFYFYPGLVHELKSSPENPMTFRAVHFSYACTGYLNGQWSIEEGNIPLPVKTVSEILTHRKLEDILKEMHTYWLSKAPGYDLICNGLFIQLYYFTMQNMNTNDLRYSSLMKVEEVTHYIRNNLDRPLTIEQLAEMAGLSQGYLSCIFKSLTGYPLSRFINKCRIDEAKAQLESGHTKVREVAMQLGFKDEFYFSRIFKQFVGISPSEFYRNVTGN